MSVAAQIAEQVMQGYKPTGQDATQLLGAEYNELLFQANRIRAHFKGNKVHLCSIINAKSGLCSQDCRFCSQSSHYATQSAEYPMVAKEELLRAFQDASGRGVKCFSVVTSGRAVGKDEIDAICDFMDTADKSRVRLSASLGELDLESLKALKKHGMKRFHHNIETAESFFPSICTTHSYKDRVATIKRAKEAGLEVCCGGIFGLGESPEQRIEFALTLRELDVDSVPMNFLNPIAGTPFEHQPRLSPREILAAIALFRFMLPEKSISVCGGREVNLRDMQSWIFYAGANGMMAGGYLTTQGRPAEQDLQMIKDLGYECE